MLIGAYIKYRLQPNCSSGSRYSRHSRPWPIQNQGEGSVVIEKELTLTANLALWNTNQVKQNKIQNFSWKFRLLKRFVKRCYRDGWTTQMASCNGRRRHEIPFWRQKTSPKSISIATSIFVKVRLRNVFIIIPAHELFSLSYNIYLLTILLIRFAFLLTFDNKYRYFWICGLRK